MNQLVYKTFKIGCISFVSVAGILIGTSNLQMGIIKADDISLTIEEEKTLRSNLKCEYPKAITIKTYIEDCPAGRKCTITTCGREEVQKTVAGQIIKENGKDNSVADAKIGIDIDAYLMTEEEREVEKYKMPLERLNEKLDNAVSKSNHRGFQKYSLLDFKDIGI